MLFGHLYAVVVSLKELPRDVEAETSSVLTLSRVEGVEDKG